MKITELLRPKSKAQIETILDEFIAEFESVHLHPEFTWRPGQKEAVQQIVYTYLKKKHTTVILDAPVGSGKSLIAMAVAFILNRQNKRGYVLTSEITLQDQYESDIKKYMLDWGSVKGVDNYPCIDNMEKHSLGTCKIRNVSPRTLGCYDSCPYFTARDNAAISLTSVLNYNYWLIMMNGTTPFTKRDFTICDEAHKISDIVQNHYSPRFTKNTVEKLRKLADFLHVHKVADHRDIVNVIERSIATLWELEDTDHLLHHLSIIEKALFTVKKEIVSQKYPKKKPPKEWIQSLYLADWVKDVHCKVQDYNYIINSTGTKNLVKNPSGDELVFNSLDDSFMMQRFFHRYTGFTVLMSATIADPREFMKTMNIKDAKYIKVENHFQFEKSPIYYYPNRKMTYKDFDSNKQWLFSKVNELLEKHRGESGLIHTGSYDMALKIRDALSPENRKRVFVYEGTDEKRKALDAMKAVKGMVIMGPSILEGLDMKDDLSRFAIFAKVPYMSLSDRLVKAKMNNNPTWYRWKAIVSILQGVGRNVRSEEDWAVTYMLDGSLGDLIHNNRKSFPPEFLQRIVVVQE